MAITSTESKAEQLARVRQMAILCDGTWDTNDDDRAALQAVLADRDVLLTALTIAEELLARNGVVRPEITAALALAEGRP